jgi:pilus assembly protein Flp/PilA
MKRRGEGQGLVEYALILVLVAVVVIAILLLLGPIIGNTFSEIVNGLDENSYQVTSSSLTQNVNNQRGKGRDNLDFYKEFKDLSLNQEDALNEAKQQLQEAAGETLEVFGEYADEIGDDVLYQLVIQAQQASSGDYSDLPSALADVFAALGDAPTEVQVAVILKVVPYVINSYWALDGMQVPFEAFEPALQEIEQYPGSTEEKISLMWDAWDLVEQRNELIGEVQPGLLTGACFGITALYNTGIPENIALAQGFETQLPASSCDY